MPDRHNSIEKSRYAINFIRRKVRSAMPAQVLADNPDLETFVNALYDYLWQENNVGLATKIANLDKARDPDSTQFMASLKKDLAKDFPDTTSIDDRTLLRILYLWYLAKGSTESIETYFKIFLNSDNIEVRYPKDNLLKPSDGTWDNTNTVFTTSQGFLSETTMVLQDSYYYQLYSYVIRSGVSVVDWGEVFQKIVHPAGWEYFGEVELVGYAPFGVGVSSPTIQDCNITPDPRFLIVGSAEATALWGCAYPHIIMRTSANLYDWSAAELEQNILNSTTWTFADFGSLTFDDFANDVATDLRPGAVINIT